MATIDIMNIVMRIRSVHPVHHYVPLSSLCKPFLGETALNEVHALHIMNNLLQTRYQRPKSWLYSGLLMVNGCWPCNSDDLFWRPVQYRNDSCAKKLMSLKSRSTERKREYLCDLSGKNHQMCTGLWLANYHARLSRPV